MYQIALPMQQIFLLFVLYISSSLGFYQSDYVIRDLEETTQSEFSQETTVWKDALGNSGTAQDTDCGSIYLMGGYGYTDTSSSFVRTYENLPTHKIIAVSFEVYLIDPTGGEAVMFVIGNAFPAFGLISTPSLTNSFCGSGAINDLGPVTVLQVTKHIGSTLNFIFQMSASNTGIRNINILIGVNDITADLDCIIADPLSLFSLGGCSCPLGQYMSALCTPCDDACENCYGGDANSCYSCNDGYYFNGASCLKCDDSCETCSGSGPSACLTCPWGDPANANSECSYVCDEACATCSGPYSNMCDTCNDGYYFESPSSCLKCDDACGTCDDASSSACLICPWGDPADANSECIFVCDESCNSCSGPYSNTCDTCNDGYYFESPSSCLKCDSTCETCSDAGPSACLVCPWDVPADTNSECVLICNSACDTCFDTDSDSCLTCKDGYYPSGTSSCLKCDDSCKTCSTAGPSACLICPSGDPSDVNFQCLITSSPPEPPSAEPPVKTSTKRIIKTNNITQTMVGAGLVANTILKAGNSGAIRISMLAQMRVY